MTRIVPISGALILFAAGLVLLLIWVNVSDTAHTWLQWAALVALVIGALGLAAQVVGRFARSRSGGS